jgi:hypothetical protein
VFNEIFELVVVFGFIKDIIDIVYFFGINVPL